MTAQFLVLGIRSTSHSFVHPHHWLTLANQIRYIEYELALLPSPPRFRPSTKAPSFSSMYGNGLSLARSNLRSKAHAQHGIEIYTDALVSLDTTGTQGVSSSAWFPMMNAPGLNISESASRDSGSKACTFKLDWVEAG